MKTSPLLLLILFASSFKVTAQRTEQFGKFTDQNATAIRGTSLEKGYERQLQILNLQVVSTTTTTVFITIPNAASVISFQSLVNTKSVLQSGEISVLKLEAERKVLSQKIVMASIKVKSVVTIDNAVRIELIPGSFQQTFYTTDRNGKLIQSKN